MVKIELEEQKEDTEGIKRINWYHSEVVQLLEKLVDQALPHINTH